MGVEARRVVAGHIHIAFKREGPAGIELVDTHEEDEGKVARVELASKRLATRLVSIPVWCE